METNGTTLRTYMMPSEVDIMMIIIYTTRNGIRREKETTRSKLHTEIAKIQERGGWSIKVL